MIIKRKKKDGSYSYQVRVTHPDYATQVRTFRLKKQAEQWERTKKQEMEEGNFQDERTSVKKTLGDAIDRYCTKVIGPHTKNYKTIMGQLKWWKNQLGRYPLTRLTSDVLVQKRDVLRTEIIRTETDDDGKVIEIRRSDSTANRYLSNLSSVLKKASSEWGWCRENPCRKISDLREPEGRTRYLTQDELDRLLDACEASTLESLALIVMIAVGSGMRKSEIISMKYSELSLETGDVLLKSDRTKTKKCRVAHITGYPLEKLRQWAINRTSDFVFPNKTGNGPIEIKHAWEKALQTCGVQEFCFHCLRHCTGSFLAQRNISTITSACILGHANLDMTRKYSHLSDAYKRDVLTEMNRDIFKNR